MPADEDASTFPEPPERVSSGIPGLDAILGGGLFKGGIYVIAGSPGAGKTVLANQMGFAHVRSGGRVLYVTLLSETHGRMLSQMQTMGFFDRLLVGDRLTYVSGFNQLESEGLGGLLTLVRRTARDQRATLLVLDGFVTASTFARSEIDYKKFINELQTWVGLVGCTVLLLTSAGAHSPEVAIQPEHTMVDGIVTLNTSHFGLRSMRHLRVAKFRGSSYVEGAHSYAISNQGVTVYPRLEASRLWGTRDAAGARAGEAEPSKPERKISTGVGRLDSILDGGLTAGSATLVVGSSGAGKTILGLHFLDAGARAEEPGLFFGFFEEPATLAATAERLGMPFRRHLERELIWPAWHPPGERLLDAVGTELMELVRRHRIRRLFFDGLGVLKRAAVHRGRAGRYLVALVHELGALGVTTMISEETGELFVRKIEPSITGISTAFQNILFLRQVESDGRLRRLLSIMKTRGGGHDNGLFAFEIGDTGIAVKAPFRRVRGPGLSTGYLGATHPSDEELPPSDAVGASRTPAGRSRRKR